jgi:gliding motility-associated-like protein
LNDLGGPNIVITNQVNPSCGQSNGSITANGSAGTAPYQYSINGGVFQSSGTFSGLAAGSYSVQVRDAAGCQATTNVVLSDASANLPKATIESSALTLCEGYDLNLKGNLPAGTMGMWSSNSLIPANPNNPIWNLTPPTAGNFVVSWTLSAPGCPNYDTKSIQIQVIALPQALNDGAFNVSNGASVSIDMLDNDNFILPVNARIIRQPKLGSVNINNQNRIEYTAFSSSDGPDTLVYEICYSNCLESCDTATVLFRTINNDNPCVITSDTSNILTNGITPNDDGFNDNLVFRVVSLEECEVNYARGEIIIYNRWGDVVFSASPYNNDWKGTNANGDALPPGVYYFVLRISAPERLYTQFGSVILLR